MKSAAALGALVLLGALTACASEAPEDPAQPQSQDAQDGPEGQDVGQGEGMPSGEAPEECASAFPQAFTEPDLAEVSSLPADWPEPPAGSTLCLTSSGLGDAAVESISYATDAVPEDVLAHYEQELTGYTLERSPAPTGGEVLSGSGEDLRFQIQPRDGGFMIALQPGG